jgi:cell wall-associated NlpC family hydrolase
MYAGNGQVVHAPQTGDVVKVVPFSNYGRRLVGAVRP